VVGGIGAGLITRVSHLLYSALFLFLAPWLFRLLCYGYDDTPLTHSLIAAYFSFAWRGVWMGWFLLK
jgi:hypothetical protein